MASIIVTNTGPARHFTIDGRLLLIGLGVSVKIDVEDYGELKGCPGLEFKRCHDGDIPPSCRNVDFSRFPINHLRWMAASEGIRVKNTMTKKMLVKLCHEATRL
jgi:hypothetical protein